MKEYKKLFTIMLMITLLLSLTGCGKKKDKEKEPEVLVNTSEDVIKTQTLGNFKFENTSLTYSEGTSLLEITVTNTGNTVEYLKEFNIAVKDKDGNTMITLVGFVGDHIKAGESKVITSYSGENLTTAASIEYEVIK